VLDEILDYVVAGQALQPAEALEVPYFWGVLGRRIDDLALTRP